MLSSHTSLQTLHLEGCSSLTALPGVSSLTSLQKLDLRDCSSLTALPDVSSLTSLKHFYRPFHLESRRR